MTILSEQSGLAGPRPKDRRLLPLVGLLCLILAAVIVFWTPLAALITMVVILTVGFLAGSIVGAVRRQRAAGASYNSIVGRALVSMPFLMVLASIFLLPIDEWSVQFKIAGLNMSPSLQMLALLALVTALLWRKGRVKSPILEEPQLAWIGVLAIVTLASTAQAVHLQVAVGTFDVYQTRLLTLIVLGVFASTCERVNLVVWVLILGMAVSAGAGVIERLGGTQGRLDGLSEHVNRFGNNCATVLAFSVYLALRRKGDARLAAVVLSLLLAAGLLISQSRGALFSLSMVGVVMVFHFNGGARLRVIAVAVAGLMALWTAAPPQFIERIQSIATDVTVQRRVAYADLALQMFEERPLLGYGPDNFPRVYARSEYGYWLGEKSRESGRPAHNAFLQILSELGILGSLAFSGLLLSNLLALHRARRILLERDDQVMLGIVEGTQAAIAVYIFGSMFASSQFEPMFWFLISFPITISLAVRRKETPLEPGPQGNVNPVV